MRQALLAIGLLGAMTGCSSAYYNTMEKFGVHKRDILVDRVEEARDAQQGAQKQFKSALEQFRSVVKVDESNLSKVYDKLNGEYEDSKKAAEDISQRIDDVESVAQALFKEWENELKDYQNASLRRDSERKLQATRTKYQSLIKAMRKTEDRLDPVLTTMYDQVLYLKHNLNASAIQSLRDEVVKIDQDVSALIKTMQRAIDEADSFIRDMKD